jgi:hypothetical protein
MSDAPSYTDALAEARARIVGEGGLGRRTAAEMRRVLAQMLVDLNRDVEEGQVTSARAAALRESIDQALQRFRDQAVVVLEQARRDAMQAAAQGHAAGLEQLASQEDVPAGTIAVSFDDVPEQVLRVGMTRRAIGGAETMQTLVNRNVQEAAGDIDDVIESAIGRGVSNQRLTKSLTAELAKGDPELKELVRTMGREQGVDVDPDADPIEITEDELGRANRLDHDARRIAVSEINSHYHEADVIAAIQSPVIDLLRWRTSSRHTAEKSYVPDICDFMEAADLQGYGAGLYHPAAAPSLVHPWCQCRFEKSFKEPEDYGTGNRELPPERELSSTDVEDLLQDLDGPRTITESYVESQRQMAQEHLDAARSVAEELMG